MIPGPAGAVALLTAVLLPVLLLGLVLALDRYEERLFSPSAQRHRAGRHSRPGGRRSAAGRHPSVSLGTAGGGPRSTGAGPAAGSRSGLPPVRPKPPAVTPTNTVTP